VVLVAVVCALVLLVLVGACVTTAYAVDACSTRRRLLRANRLVRLGRAVRSAGRRSLLLPTGAAHLADVVTKTHRTPVAQSPRVAVARLGPATLWRYVHSGPSPRRNRLPVLIVHSVATRSWVLDLLPGRSLVERLVRGGHDVLLLDWGTPGPAQSTAGLDAYVDVVAWAERSACEATGATQLHVVGYCAGGTLALALHAASGRGRAASLALIAAPVDTMAVGGIGAVLGSPFLAPVLALDGDAMVPPELVRRALRGLRPRPLVTAGRVLRSKGEPWREGLGALNRWAWEQVPMPGALLFDLVDLFRGNQLVSGTLEVAGAPVDLRRLVGVPLLVVTAVRDHLVPPASTLALLSVPGLSVTTLQCSTGHVAMLAGSEAERVLYPGLIEWLAELNQPVVRELPGPGPAPFPE
jgi:polyhydroxyalkanoate synthase